MDKKDKTIFILLTFVLLISLLSNTIAGENIVYNQKLPILNTTNTYNGYLRIYIVEPTSRWDMYNEKPYHNGFLDFAYEGLLSLEYNETYENSITWTGDVNESNVFVIAAIFNPFAKIGYAYPPSSKPFEAYYVDAAAAAYPNQTGSNTRNETITHTVFIEEGTATWCKNCPDVADALYNVSKTSEYPFYYVAMIQDMNEDVADRLKNDYNIYGYPTVFFDGGKEVIIGGNHDEVEIDSLIENCAKSDVHDLDLNLSVEWLGNGKLKIDYNITNLEDIDNQMLNIKKVWGGIKKVWALVENAGEMDLKDVEWKIIVKGGLINRINTTTPGIIENFPIGCKKLIRTKVRLFQIYGFGKIDVIIQVGTSVKKSTGLALGKYIIIKK